MASITSGNPMYFANEYRKLIVCLLKVCNYASVDSETKEYMNRHSAIFKRLNQNEINVMKATDPSAFIPFKERLYEIIPTDLESKLDGSWLTSGEPVIVRVIRKSNRIEVPTAAIWLSKIYLGALKAKISAESDETIDRGDMIFKNDKVILLHLYRIFNIDQPSEILQKTIQDLELALGLRSSNINTGSFMSGIGELASGFLSKNPQLGQMFGIEKPEELVGKVSETFSKINLDQIVGTFKAVTESGAIEEVTKTIKKHADPNKSPLENIVSIAQEKEKLSGLINDVTSSDKVKEATTKLTQAAAPILNTMAHNLPEELVSTSSTSKTEQETPQEVYDE
jgi:hypothetical protein